MRLFASSRHLKSITAAAFLCTVMAAPSWSVATQQTPQTTAEVVDLLKKAYAQLGSGSVDDAIGTLNSVIKLDRNSAMARRYLCYALIQRGEPREAISQLDALAQLNCGVPFDLCMRGQALQLLGEYKKATESFKAAIGLDPTSDYIRDKLIDSLQMSGDYKEAAAVCADGYYASQDKKQKDHYLDIFNQVQQARTYIGGGEPTPTPTAPAAEAGTNTSETTEYTYGQAPVQVKAAPKPQSE
jgi:tetratricopeptide (TPR) repeat protein